MILPIPRRLLLAPVLFAALFLGAGPASAEPVPDVECPCFDDLPPAIVCFINPPLNSFGYVPSLNWFVQVTPGWCRVNGTFRWVTPLESAECAEEIEDACFGDDSDTETDDPIC